MMTPELFINGRALLRPVTGVERYTREIRRRLPAGGTTLRPRRLYRGAAGHIWEQTVLPLRVRASSWQGRQPLLWSPANTGPLAVRSQVLTIHDLAPLEHPKGYRPAFSLWYRWLWPRLARRVSHILTDSEFSRGRIVTLLGVPERKVTAVPLGVDAGTFHPAPDDKVQHFLDRAGLRQPYILFTGTVQPRKNLNGLLASWAGLQRAFPSWQLVIAGDIAGPFRAVDMPPEKRVRILGRVAEQDLPALYSGAGVFVQPSFYEGGGLTVLEAMACGCPVAAAGNTALPEYLGEAGIEFNPHSPDDLERSLRRLLEDDGLRDELSRRGIERAREFSWARPAAEVGSVLQATGFPSSP